MGDNNILLKDLYIVSIKLDGIEGPVSESNPAPATWFTQDSAFIPTGVDEDGEATFVPNPSQGVDFSQTFDLKIRSCSKTKLWVGITLHGVFHNPHEAGVFGSLIPCISPGEVKDVHIVCEKGFSGLLILHTEPILKEVT